MDVFLFLQGFRAWAKQGRKNCLQLAETWIFKIVLNLLSV